jgi:Kef-type K+ transport system membrane component KefB
MITGYLIAGILVGPDLLRYLSTMDTEQLHLIDELALGIIAITAGGELRLHALRQQRKSLIYIVSLQTVLVFLGALFAFWLIAAVWPEAFAAPHGGKRLAILLFLALACIANSPATAIAVIAETRSAGPLTDRVIGVTVIKDVVVLVFFTLLMALTQISMGNAAVSPLQDVGRLVWVIGGALFIGALAGFAFIGYQKYVREDVEIFVLGITFALSAITTAVHVEFVLACVTAGFLVENFSDYGEHLIRSIERSALPIFVIFFSISGASLDLGALAEFWALAGLIVFVRLFLTHASSWIGSHLAGDPPAVRNYLWTGFIGQAGITLGIAILIRNEFATSFGPYLHTLILSAIVINQLIGPVLFRIGLEKAGELNRKSL